MPRRRNRFADLERQLRAAGGSAAAGSRLGNFADFKAGKRKIKIDQVPDRALMNRTAFAAYPFNVSVPASPTAADRFMVTVTTYSKDQIKDKGVSKADLGWDEFVAGNTVEPQYYPSLIKCFTPASTTAVAAPKVSGITGDSYKKMPGKSASAPFGRTLAALDKKTAEATGALTASEEEDVRKHLTNKLTSGAPVGKKATSVSYEPEVFRGRTQAIEAGVF